MKGVQTTLPYPAIGIAYAGYVSRFVDAFPQDVDFVEVPYELLAHDGSVLDSLKQRKPVILHCASLSVAGTVPCSAATLAQIRRAVRDTDTPWVGEHLAYVTADSRGDRLHPYDVRYTVAPPLNAETLRRVQTALERYEARLGTALILENSPQYFRVPNSTMSQAKFLRELHASSRVGLLLDLTHLYISSRNMGFDPFQALEQLPLEAVVEVHVSGVGESDGVWDDHATPAPDVVRRLLDCVLQRTTPRAITLEYNWSVRFPWDVLRRELHRTREQVQRACDRNAVPA